MLLVEKPRSVVLLARNIGTYTGIYSSLLEYEYNRTHTLLAVVFLCFGCPFYFDRLVSQVSGQNATNAEGAIRTYQAATSTAVRVCIYQV